MTLLLLLPPPPPLALLLVMRESSFSSSSEASPGTIMIIAGFKINQIKFRELQVVHRQTGKCISLFLSFAAAALSPPGKRRAESGRFEWHFSSLFLEQRDGIAQKGQYRSVCVIVTGSLFYGQHLLLIYL